MNRKSLVILGTAVSNLLTANEDSSSSSSSSEDDDIQVRAVFFNAFASLVPEVHPRQVGYLQVISQYSCQDFWRHFRVSRASFGLLLHHLQTDNFRSEVAYHGGFEPMTNSEMLLIALQYLGNQGAIGLLADKFNRTESSIWNAVDLICKFFYQKQSKFIKFPARNEMRKTAAQFYEKANFPGVVGAVDGWHIEIHPTTENELAYRNHKKFHSFNLMAVVLPDRTFSYIFTGFPGSSHDSYVFRRSSLYQQIENQQRFNYDRYHLIGDSAFPLKAWLLVPYKKTAAGLTRSQKEFNRRLSASRIVVENAFGDLKNRFRRCQDIYATIDKTVHIVVTCCVIHNICIRNGDLNHNLHENAALHCDVNPPYPGLNHNNQAGNRKRETIRERM
jgi:hypothetical protein